MPIIPKLEQFHKAASKLLLGSDFYPYPAEHAYSGYLQAASYYEWYDKKEKRMVMGYHSAFWYQPYWMFLITDPISTFISVKITEPLKYRWCERFGHKLTSAGYAGPDSGYENIYCRRCGFSYPTVHYY